MLVPHLYLRLIGAASAVSAAVAAHPNATSFSTGADFARELKPKSSKHPKTSKESSHFPKTSKGTKENVKNKSACAKAIEGSWLYDCPSCECNRWLVTLSCEGDRCAYTEREHPTECGLAPRYSESWDYPCIMSGNAPAGVAGIEMGYMEFSSEIIIKGGGENEIICELGSTTTPINLGNFGEHCTKEITESEHSYSVKAEFSSDEMHLYVSVDGGKFFTGLRNGNRFVEERMVDGPDGGRELQIIKPIKQCPTCEDWIPCKKDKTKATDCLTDLVGVARKGHTMVKSLMDVVKKPSVGTGLAFLKTTIEQFATLHPALSVSFAIATWLFSEEEIPPKEISLLTELNEEFKKIHTRLDTIDNAISDVSYEVDMLGCDVDINKAIGSLISVKRMYDLAVNNENNVTATSAMEKFMTDGCPILDRLDGSIYLLISTLKRPYKFGFKESCIEKIYEDKKYHMKGQKFYREIVAPLAKWIVSSLQMTAVCPSINEGNYKLLTIVASELIETISVATVEHADNEWMDTELIKESHKSLLKLGSAEAVRKELEYNWSNKYVYSVIKTYFHNTNWNEEWYNGSRNPPKTPAQFHYNGGWADGNIKMEGAAIIYDYNEGVSWIKKPIVIIFYLRVADRKEGDVYGKNWEWDNWIRRNDRSIHCYENSCMCCATCEEYTETVGCAVKYSCCSKSALVKDENLYKCRSAKWVSNLAMQMNEELKLDGGSGTLLIQEEVTWGNGFSYLVGQRSSVNEFYGIKDKILTKEVRTYGTYHAVEALENKFAQAGCDYYDDGRDPTPYFEVKRWNGQNKKYETGNVTMNGKCLG